MLVLKYPPQQNKSTRLVMSTNKAGGLGQAEGPPRQADWVKICLLKLTFFVVATNRTYITLSGGPLGFTVALLTNIRIGWKWLVVTDRLDLHIAVLIAPFN